MRINSSYLLTFNIFQMTLFRTDKYDLCNHSDNSSVFLINKDID